MKGRMVLWAVVLAATFAAPAARAATWLGPTIGVGPPIGIVPFFNWKCVHADGRACSDGERANPWYKQVFITSTGFAPEERDTFFSEFDRIVAMMTGPGAGNVWSVQHRDQLLFIGYFTAGGPLGTPAAAFGGLIAQHPIRGYATSLSQQAVYDAIARIGGDEVSNLRPFTAGVLFNSYQRVTANAAPPSFVQRPFGIAKFTREDLDERGSYITTHELAHAGLNYLDEYVERGFENLDIRQFDAATPLVEFDWTWGGFVRAIDDLLHVYDYNVSEILAANGNDNVALSPWPSTVSTPWYSGESYAYEHGMFFGRGTWHMAGLNLMNSNLVQRAPDDGFGFAHSPSQQRVIWAAFDGWIGRPNDRIRAAGPKNGWPLQLGSETHVMIYDGDKNHHFHPTLSYTVQVGWYERVWHTCWAAFFPYPCHDNEWRTAEKVLQPEARSIALKSTALYGLGNLAQGVVCAVGINEVPSANGTVRLCDQPLATLANNLLPTLSFPVPYQDVDVPASQWLTTYWWRFRTDNGAWTSGWTGWSSFYRSL